MKKDFSWIKKGVKVLYEDEEREVIGDVCDCIGRKVTSPDKYG